MPDASLPCSFGVALDPAACLIEIDGDPIRATGWTFLPIEVPKGHVVARGPVSDCRTRI